MPDSRRVSTALAPAPRAGSRPLNLLFLPTRIPEEPVLCPLLERLTSFPYDREHLDDGWIGGDESSYDPDSLSVEREGATLLA